MTLENALDQDRSIFADKHEIHISDVSDFKKCRRSWNWSSRLREGLEPRRVYSPFFFGRAVHHCIEQLYAFGTPFDVSLPQFVETETANLGRLRGINADDYTVIAENREQAVGLLKHYEAWEDRLTGPFSMRNLEFVTLEQEFAIPIFDPYSGDIMPNAFYAGKWDGIVRRRDNGDLYIWEFKTSRAIAQRVKMLDNDAQATMYINAARTAFGLDVKGMLYTVAGKRVPTKPRVLLSGELTRSVTNAQQTVESYLAFVREHHPDADDAWIGNVYGSALMALDSAENTYFQRHIVYRNQHALDVGMRDMYDTAHDMIDPTLRIYPAPGYGCNTCLFRDPCVSLQDGADYATLIKYDYQPRSFHAVSSDEES